MKTPKSAKTQRETSLQAFLFIQTPVILTPQTLHNKRYDPAMLLVLHYMVHTLYTIKNNQNHNIAQLKQTRNIITELCALRYGGC
jgi:hypothetical protein